MVITLISTSATDGFSWTSREVCAGREAAETSEGEGRQGLLRFRASQYALQPQLFERNFLPRVPVLLFPGRLVADFSV